MTVIA